MSFFQKKKGSHRMGKRITIYDSGNFTVSTMQENPHIDRKDGGHLMVASKEHFTDRTEFPPALATEAMRLSIIAGKALKRAMRERGINVQRINYQENGNWAFRNGGSYAPYFHIHLYCRTPESKEQTWGQALRFPDPDTGYYDHLEPLNEEDIQLIVKYISEYDCSEEYAPEHWTLG